MAVAPKAVNAQSGQQSGLFRRNQIRPHAYRGSILNVLHFFGALCYRSVVHCLPLMVRGKAEQKIVRSGVRA